MATFDFARRWLVIGAVLGFAQAAAAHHSYSMFDSTRTVTVKGTVAKLSERISLKDPGTRQFDVVTMADLPPPPGW